MATKKLTPAKIKKINDEIRRLQYKSWNSSVSEVNKIRDRIHVLQKQLENDEQLKKQVIIKKPTLKKAVKKTTKKPAPKSEKTFIVNGYKIKYSNFWGNYGVSHDEIGANIATFKLRKDAVDYCKRG